MSDQMVSSKQIMSDKVQATVLLILLFYIRFLALRPPPLMQEFASAGGRLVTHVATKLGKLPDSSTI